MRTFPKLRWKVAALLSGHRWRRLINVLLTPRIIRRNWQPQGRPVLFIIEGGIGDLVLAEPVIRAFQEQHGPSSIALAVSSNVIAFAQCLMRVESLLETDRADRRGELLQHLRRDLVVGFRTYPTTSWLVRVSGAKVIGWRDWAKPASAVHETEVMAGIAQVTIPSELQPIALSPTERQSLAVLKVGGQSLRSWSPQKWAFVIRELVARGFEVILVGSALEKSDCENVMWLADVGTACQNKAGETSPEGLLTLLDRAEVVIGSDSGVMHLAAHHGRPTITLFGPVRPDIWRPQGRWPHIEIYKERACSPCQQNYCPYPVGQRCMDDIEASDIMDAVSIMNLNAQERKSTANGEAVHQ